MLIKVVPTSPALWLNTGNEFHSEFDVVISFPLYPGFIFCQALFVAHGEGRGWRYEGERWSHLTSGAVVLKYLDILLQLPAGLYSHEVKRNHPAFVETNYWVGLPLKSEQLKSSAIFFRRYLNWIRSTSAGIRKLKVLVLYIQSDH